MEVPMLFLRVISLVVTVSLSGSAIAAETPNPLFSRLRVTNKGVFLNDERISCAKLAALTQQHLSADHGTYFDEHCVRHDQTAIRGPFTPPDKP
jgi:hypothetical protein